MRAPAAPFRRFLSVVLALLIAVSPLVAAAPQEPPGATFTAESNLVLVPVIVTSGNQHVSGLTQSDFTILDDGKPVKIASFEEIKQVPATMSHPQQTGMYTNAVDQPQTAHGMTVIVLDQINTPFLDQSYARAQLLKFLAEHVDINEPVALIMIGRRGVRVIHDFTTSPKLLVAALKKVSSRSDTLTLDDSSVSASVAGLEVSELDSFYAGTDGGYGQFEITQAIEITFSALQHIAQGLEGIPGRKSLIWVTGGFPFEITSSGDLAALRYYTTGATHQAVGGLVGGVGAGGALPPLPESSVSTADDFASAIRPYWQRAMQAMNKANIAIYPIDARGLVAYSSAVSSRVRISDVYGTEAQTHTTMNDIAEVTGGKAYYNTNDITGAFNKATGETRQYYMIGYYAEKADKVKWHKLQVKLDKPGLEARTRTGYMAGTVTTKKPDDLRNADIRAAIASPLDYTGLPLKLWLDPAQPAAGGKKKVPFEVDIVPGGATVDKANKNRVSLEFVVIARNAQGDPAAQFGQKIDINLKDDQLATFAAKGLNYNQALQLAPGTYQVRVIVRDNLGGKVGSVIAPLQVQ